VAYFFKSPEELVAINQVLNRFLQHICRAFFELLGMHLRKSFFHFRSLIMSKKFISEKSGVWMVCLFTMAALFSSCHQGGPRVLVFAKTKGYHHESIPDGIAAIKQIGKEHHFEVDETTDASDFNENKLKQYRAVVFLSSTGNVLNAEQQVAFQRYIEAGGGYMGIHAAADCEYTWPWYNGLVGAYFMSDPGNPNVRKATVVVSDTSNAAMKGIPQRWERTDEWYNYKSINPTIKVIAKLDEESYEGGENGENHPIAWYHNYDGGRAFYTGGGHTKESYSEPLFLQHLTGGLLYAMGDGTPLDFSKSYAVRAPEENRFVKTVLSNDLNEPMELAVAPDGRVFFIERSGNFYLYDPTTKNTKLVYKFPVLPDTKQAFGNGLLGLTIDPDFAHNNFIYFFYTPNKTPAAQHVARFNIINKDSLDLSSEKTLIEIPIDMEVSAHTGGSLAWDAHGNLFISTGDNTVPFESDGYAPIDERAGRKTFDAQRSAGNTNDLRGKILRIHPEKDGTYSIPDGNLFAKGTPQTRPEIYTMGCRNPYRISVDPATSILYWGEIGPDAGVDGAQGPRGYDEINQAKKAGNYGWPYFVGDSKQYHEYDFSTKAISDLFDPKAPVNTSPNNTGAKNLPPANKAMIWYPYALSDEFPELATGGRSAMAGPVYHYNSAGTNDKRIPEYYNNALFVFDWMRNWVFAVRLDDQQQFKRMEPFMQSNGDFRRPIDMEIASDGVMYLLEYGSVYGIDNDDARLVKVEYNSGNRAPVAKISANDSIGLAPLKVSFNSNKTADPDEDDELSYEWHFEGNAIDSKEAKAEHTFTKNGVYKVILKVSDPSGLSSMDTMEIKVGNTLPQVNVTTTGNSTFFFPETPVNYSVQVKDNEDKTIDSSKLSVSLDYLPKAVAMQALMGHQQSAGIRTGKSLIEANDCKACHQLEGKSVGPAFMEVSKKYQGKSAEIPRLANKVITGGGGVWGDHAMNAHPQLSKQDATTIVEYVVSLTERKSYNNLPSVGTIDLKANKKAKEDGSYVINASYTDQGGNIVPLTNHGMLVLRPARVQAEDADVIRNIQRGNDQLGSIHNKSYFVFKNIDLKDIKQIRLRYSSKDIGATIEIHKGSAKGEVLASIPYKSTGDWEKFAEITSAIKDPGGKNDLYFVFKKDDEPNQHMCSVDWIEFLK
jgi:cytochrome c